MPQSIPLYNRPDEEMFSARGEEDKREENVTEGVTITDETTSSQSIHGTNSST